MHLDLRVKLVNVCVFSWVLQATVLHARKKTHSNTIPDQYYARSRLLKKLE